MTTLKALNLGRLPRPALVFLGAAIIAIAFVTISHADSGGTTVEFRDRCEPNSFNAAVGPGTCVGSGDITFAQFIQRLIETGTHNQWRYSRTDFEVRRGEPIKLVNRGGETHSFTKVDQFAGGFVIPLNALSGNFTPSPACAVYDNNRPVLNLDDPSGTTFVPVGPNATSIFVPAGGRASLDTAPLTGGMYRFECCIHPWMQAVVRVRES